MIYSAHPTYDDLPLLPRVRAISRAIRPAGASALTHKHYTQYTQITLDGFLLVNIWTSEPPNADPYTGAIVMAISLSRGYQGRWTIWRRVASDGTCVRERGVVLGDFWRHPWQSLAYLRHGKLPQFCKGA